MKLAFFMLIAYLPFLYGVRQQWKEDMKKIKEERLNNVKVHDANNSSNSWS